MVFEAQMIDICFSTCSPERHPHRLIETQKKLSLSCLSDPTVCTYDMCVVLDEGLCVHV